MEEKKKSIGKWVFIIVTILGLALLSMIAAGIIAIIYGISSLGSMSSEPTMEYGGVGNVAVIPIKGVILTETESGLFSTSQDTSSSQLVKQIEQINNDENIQAVIFEINSPGGSGVAADEIATAIKKLNKTKIAVVREMGTSAAYWIASSTDYIIANKMSAVGSIGVIASYLDFSEFIEEYNVSYQQFVAGKNKDFGSPFREPTSEEKARFQKQLDIMHGIFIDEVALNRNMSREEVVKVADGMFMLGIEAKEAKLIDELGGMPQAKAYLEKELNTTITIVEIKKKESFLDLFTSAKSATSYNIGRGIGDSIMAKSSMSSTMQNGVMLQ